MNYAALIPLFPLVGFVIVALFGKKIKNEKIVGAIASSAILLSFLTAVNTFMGLQGMPPEERLHVHKVFTWIATGSFSVDVAYQFDQLSILFTLIITGIGFLIHLYSIG